MAPAETGRACKTPPTDSESFLHRRYSLRADAASRLSEADVCDGQSDRDVAVGSGQLKRGKHGKLMRCNDWTAQRSMSPLIFASCWTRDEHKNRLFALQARETWRVKGLALEVSVQPCITV